MPAPQVSAEEKAEEPHPLRGPLLLVEVAAPPLGEAEEEVVGIEVAVVEVEVSQSPQGSKEATGADLLDAESEDETALAEAEIPILNQLLQQLQ